MSIQLKCSKFSGAWKRQCSDFHPPITRKILAFLASLLLSSNSVAAVPDRAPWTAHDLDRVADAVTAEALAGPGDGTAKAMALTRLTDALVQAGYLERAKAAAVQAGHLLLPPTDFMTSGSRGSVVEDLAKLGDIPDAASLAGVDATPAVSAGLLGKLGAGEALSGNSKAAIQTADGIQALLAKNEPAVAQLAGSVANARAAIGVGLATSGAIDAALEIANSLPEGVPKINLLSQTARLLCQPSNEHNERNVGRGAVISQQSAVTATGTTLIIAAPREHTRAVEIAAGAVAECKGAKAALVFLNTLNPQQFSLAAAHVSRDLTYDGNYALARGILPTPNPGDPDDLLFAAEEAKKWGDLPTARALAINASQVALKNGPSQPGPGWYDQLSLLGRIFSLLVDCSAYDQALATVQPAGPDNGRQYYVAVVQAAANHKDKVAITNTLPKAIEAVQVEGMGADRSAEFLSRMAVTLASSGYKQEAKVAADALTSISDQPASSRRRKPDAAMLAEFQAVMGDVPGALAAADNAGPLVIERSETQKRIIATMAMALSGSNISTVDPTATNQIKQLEASADTAYPGPKANVLSAIARVLAEKGEISSAIQAEAGLDGEPRAALSICRDPALAAIFDAQLHIDDLEAALDTALRISGSGLQERLLLKLAAMPIRR